jgi:hypothetical protein
VLLVSGIGLALETGTIYTNPVSKDFADPAIIEAKDGYWYDYGTSDPSATAQLDYLRVYRP